MADRVTFFVLGTVVGAAILFAAEAAGLVYRDLRIMRASPSYAFDLYDDQPLADFCSHIFVGRVVEESGRESRSFRETQYRVEVLDVIKGDLPAEVTVNQQGGYEPFLNQPSPFQRCSRLLVVSPQIRAPTGDRVERALKSCRVGVLRRVVHTRRDLDPRPGARCGGRAPRASAASTSSG